jgi:hypothetical protein
LASVSSDRRAQDPLALIQNELGPRLRRAWR